jgi:hypothetical protein
MSPPTVTIGGSKGATTYSAELTMNEQPGAIPTAQGQPCLLLWNSAIDYTLVADERRFVAIAVAAGEPVESCFCGFFQPYGPPSKYPFPLFIGGCHQSPTTKNHTVQESTHSWWATDNSSATGQQSNAHCLMPDGSTWARLRQWTSGSLDNAETYVFLMPTGGMSSTNTVGPMENGDYFKHEVMVVIHQTLVGEDVGDEGFGDKALVGRMEGVYSVTGFGLTTGTTLCDDPAHYAFQNTYRNGLGDFQAVALKP